MTHTQPVHFSIPEERVNQQTLAVIGAGAWGTALADLASRNDHKIRLWSRRSEATLPEVVEGVDIILSAVSMKGVRSVIEQLQAIEIPTDTIIITATKGLDPQTTHTPSQIWQDAFPEHPVVPTYQRKLKKAYPQRQSLLVPTKKQLVLCKISSPQIPFGSM
jgi:glycerol-3-phosphate dehydrogenase (NAD(P)+)